MPILQPELLLYISAGALVGFAVGLTGVGGGSLMTPLLLLFGFRFSGILLVFRSVLGLVLGLGFFLCSCSVPRLRLPSAPTCFMPPLPNLPAW